MGGGRNIRTGDCKTLYITAFHRFGGAPYIFFNKSNPEKCRELVVKVVFGLHSNTPTLHLPSSPPLPISQIKPQAPV